MNKKNKIIIFSLFILICISISIILLIIKKDNKNITGKSLSGLAVYVSNGTDYEADDEIPTGSIYSLNTDLSYCKGNGEIGEYDSTNGTISYTFTSSDQCYLYFDVDGIIVGSGQTLTISEGDEYETVTVNSGGTLSVEGGTIDTLTNNGTCDIFGGTIDTLINSGTCDIFDGTIDALTNSGTCTMNGTGRFDVINNNGGQLEIFDGMFKSYSVVKNYLAVGFCIVDNEDPFSLSDGYLYCTGDPFICEEMGTCTCYY